MQKYEEGDEEGEGVTGDGAMEGAEQGHEEEEGSSQHAPAKRDLNEVGQGEVFVQQEVDGYVQYYEA